jgi:hypothetical protein
MGPPERCGVKPEFECGVIASVLDSGRTLAAAGHAAAVIAALGAGFAHTAPVRLAFAASILLWPIGCYLAVRVSLDAALFRAIAADPVQDSSRMDELLGSWGLMRNLKERTLEQRIRGALTLWRRHQAVFAIQLAALIGGVLMQAVGA